MREGRPWNGWWTRRRWTGRPRRGSGPPPSPDPGHRPLRRHRGPCLTSQSDAPPSPGTEQATLRSCVPEWSAGAERNFKNPPGPGRVPRGRGPHRTWGAGARWPGAGATWGAGPRQLCGPQGRTAETPSRLKLHNQGQSTGRRGACAARRLGVKTKSASLGERGPGPATGPGRGSVSSPTTRAGTGHPTRFARRLARELLPLTAALQRQRGAFRARTNALAGTAETCGLGVPRAPPAPTVAPGAPARPSTGHAPSREAPQGTASPKPPRPGHCPEETAQKSGCMTLACRDVCDPRGRCGPRDSTLDSLQETRMPAA